MNFLKKLKYRFYIWFGNFRRQEPEIYIYEPEEEQNK